MDSQDPSPRQEISQLLHSIQAPGTFSAKQTGPARGLHLEVRGVGPISFPVSTVQAEALCQIAQPAHYGKGEKTILDTDVRDTWEVPKDRVHIDAEPWEEVLRPTLDSLSEDLGIIGGRLEADFHSMLVYGPGQFFLPHQDSEKCDEMIGTLVVTLPGSFSGGALRVEHQGKSVSYRGSKKKLSFVAFYADCLHEVRPVKTGYRVVLTYNLLLDGGIQPVFDAHLQVEALVNALGRHFETPPPPRWSDDRRARRPPNRLAYLFDHQYTQRGFDWQRLKGADALRASALNDAAERMDCDIVLALVEVFESWHCTVPEPRWEYGYREHRSWRRDDEDEWFEEEPPEPEDPDSYHLEDLIDSGIQLTLWTGPSGNLEPVSDALADNEVCFTTPTVNLQAHASDYEGYMGNWGNTMERWYRRAAIVLWPRHREFVMRAEASPRWAIDALMESILLGELAQAQEDAAKLEPFWQQVVQAEELGDLLDRALRVGIGLEDPDLAALLLQPFRIQHLKPTMAWPFSSLVQEYREEWARPLVEEWCTSIRGSYQTKVLTGLPVLPELCRALVQINPVDGALAARLIVESRWRSVHSDIEKRLLEASPSQRHGLLSELPTSLYGLLAGVEAIQGADTLRDEITTFLCRDTEDQLPSYLVEILRIAVERHAPADSPSLKALHRHCVQRLETRLAKPERAPDDWSLELPSGCNCDLCAKLREFLASTSQEHLDWPIAKEKRKHIHRWIDDAELPVQHRTLRQGRPFTLQLTKTQDVFRVDARARQSWKEDLEWLRGQGFEVDTG